MLDFNESFFHLPPEERARKSEQTLDADMAEIMRQARTDWWVRVQTLKNQRVLIHLLLKADAERYAR